MYLANFLLRALRVCDTILSKQWHGRNRKTKNTNAHTNESHSAHEFDQVYQLRTPLGEYVIKFK